MERKIPEKITVNKFWLIDMNYFESFYQMNIYSKIYSNEIIDFVIQSRKKFDRFFLRFILKSCYKLL